MQASETYPITVELPGVGDVHLVVGVFRGGQGDRVMRQSILEGTYADGEPLSRDDRARAHALLPAVR